MPLYFAKDRPVVRRAGTWIMVEDRRMRLNPGEQPESRMVRFRTWGCYPLTGAVQSMAASVADSVQELALSATSERQGRAIDHDEDSSMEKKKREGYF